MSHERKIPVQLRVWFFLRWTTQIRFEISADPNASVDPVDPVAIGGEHLEDSKHWKWALFPPVKSCQKALFFPNLFLSKVWNQPIFFSPRKFCGGKKKRGDFISFLCEGPLHKNISMLCRWGLTGGSNDAPGVSAFFFWNLAGKRCFTVSPDIWRCNHWRFTLNICKFHEASKKITRFFYFLVSFYKNRVAPKKARLGSFAGSLCWCCCQWNPEIHEDVETDACGWPFWRSGNMNPRCWGVTRSNLMAGTIQKSFGTSLETCKHDPAGPCLSHTWGNRFTRIHTFSKQPEQPEQPGSREALLPISYIHRARQETNSSPWKLVENDVFNRESGCQCINKSISFLEVTPRPLLPAAPLRWYSWRWWHWWHWYWWCQHWWHHWQSDRITTHSVTWLTRQDELEPSRHHVSVARIDTVSIHTISNKTRTKMVAGSVCQAWFFLQFPMDVFFFGINF